MNYAAMPGQRAMMPPTPAGGYASNAPPNFLSAGVGSNQYGTVPPWLNTARTGFNFPSYNAGTPSVLGGGYTPSSSNWAGNLPPGSSMPLTNPFSNYLFGQNSPTMQPSTAAGSPGTPGGNIPWNSNLATAPTWLGPNWQQIVNDRMQAQAQGGQSGGFYGTFYGGGGSQGPVTQAQWTGNPQTMPAWWQQQAQQGQQAQQSQFMNPIAQQLLQSLMGQGGYNYGLLGGGQWL